MVESKFLPHITHAPFPLSHVPFPLGGQGGSRNGSGLICRWFVALFLCNSLTEWKGNFLPPTFLSLVQILEVPQLIGRDVSTLLLSYWSKKWVARKRATNYRTFHRPFDATRNLRGICCSFSCNSFFPRFWLAAPLPTPLLKWIAKEKSNKRGAEKKWIAKKEQQILKISLSPGRQDHGARGKNEKICRDSGNYLNMLRLALNSCIRRISVSAFICLIEGKSLSRRLVSRSDTFSKKIVFFGC